MSDDQSKHRTTALHFVDLETPSSTNGIPSLLHAGIQVQYSTRQQVVSLVAARGRLLISREELDVRTHTPALN